MPVYTIKGEQRTFSLSTDVVSINTSLVYSKIGGVAPLLSSHSLRIMIYSQRSLELLVVVVTLVVGVVVERDDEQ